MPVSIDTRVLPATPQARRSLPPLRSLLVGVSSLALVLAVAPLVAPHAPHIAFSSGIDMPLVLLGISFVSAGAVLRRRAH
jgi:hypothetical protein